MTLKHLVSSGSVIMLSAVNAECCVFIFMLGVAEHQEDKQKKFSSEKIF
jgi:hypothetical protein